MILHVFSLSAVEVEPAHTVYTYLKLIQCQTWIEALSDVFIACSLVQSYTAHIDFYGLIQFIIAITIYISEE